MPTFGHRSKHPMHTLQKLIDLSTLVSPTRGGFHKPSDSHVCPENSVGIDGAMDGSGDGGKCTHEHHSQSANTQTTREQHKPVSLPIQEQHLRRVYQEACSREKKLTQRAFIEFLEHTQGEKVLVPLSKEEYTDTEFLQEWFWNYGWGILRPLKTEEDLSKPISNYFINSSHNTYLSGNQLTSPSESNAYRKVLTRNCRCIEIDVWNGDTSGRMTPSRSKSPNPSLPSHRRHLSSTSLPRVAADAFESFKEEVRQRVKGVKTPSLHSRHASVNGPPLTHSISARESSQSLDPKELSERLERPRARSKSPKDSTNNGEPIVMHGIQLTHSVQATLATKTVGFREVCQAIRETAFIGNPLPIIVSLEVHADMDQQEVMVDIMKEEWAGLLLDRPFDFCKPTERQPNLYELQNKILIKVKRPPAKASVPTGTSLSLVPPKLMDEDLSGSEDERSSDPSTRRPKRVPICEKLSALSIYTHSETFRSFEHSSARTHSHIFSISEKRIDDLYLTKQAEMLAHNRYYFMRAFPESHRVDSSNPDPSPYWRKGVQMVAMNWQNWDEDMVVNDAMFQDIHGWVLKPPGYRSDDPDGTAIEYRTLDLRITIYAGQHVPLPEARHKSDIPGAVSGAGAGDKKFKPYVKVDLLVGKADQKCTTKPGGGDKAGAKAPKEGIMAYKQKTTPKETDHPDWGKDGIDLEFIDVPKVVEELSFVRFKIEDDSAYFRGNVAAWACIRLDRLQQGYRFIELTDCKGNPSEGRLFVKIDKVVR